MARSVGPRPSDLSLGAGWCAQRLYPPSCAQGLVQSQGLASGHFGRPRSHAPWSAREQRRQIHNHRWRAVSILDEYVCITWAVARNNFTNKSHSWVSREARPISLRQLMVFGRSLNEQRLVSSANYVRTELPRRYVHAFSPS